MKKSTGLVAVLALSAGLLFAGLVPAFADENETSTGGTSVDMVYKARKGKMIGSVSSGKAKCIKNRKVNVYKITRKGNSPIGSTRTDDAGAWRVSVAKARGKYGATVAPKDVTLEAGFDEYGDPWVHLLKCAVGTTTIKV